MKLPPPRPANRRRFRRRQDGFTLIEIMVVLVILAILASFAVPRLMDRPDAARQIKARSDILTLASALDLYRLDTTAYPTTEEGLKALLGGEAKTTGAAKAERKRYLDRMPKDPWGREYQYLRPGLHGEFDLFTLGADGLPGGEGANADVGNWNIDG